MGGTKASSVKLFRVLLFGRGSVLTYFSSTHCCHMVRMILVKLIQNCCMSVFAPSNDKPSKSIEEKDFSRAEGKASLLKASNVRSWPGRTRRSNIF